MYLCTGFSQIFLAGHKLDTKWIHIVRSMARPSWCVRPPTKRTLTKKQKTKSEIGLHHGIFVFRHLGEMLNTLL